MIEELGEELGYLPASFDDMMRFVEDIAGDKLAELLSLVITSKDFYEYLESFNWF